MELQDYRDLADQYYSEGKYKKAFKGYLKIARIGDHDSQYRVSQMYAKGEGHKVDLEEAYAWSALAAESGKENLVSNREEMLGRISDKDAALKAAVMLNKKYGKQALEEKTKDVAPIIDDSITARKTSGSN